MSEILSVELLPLGLDAVASGRGRSPAEVRGLMELEYEVALRERAPFAVLRIAIEDLDRIALAAAGGGGDAVLASVAEMMRTVPRSGDLLALREGGPIVAMLPRTNAEAAETWAKRLLEGARRLPVPGAPTPVVARLSVGLAFAQFDAGTWFETLLAVAQEGVEVAGSSGGGRAVHTELYAFHQKRLERENPHRPRPMAPSLVPARAEAASQPPIGPRSASGTAELAKSSLKGRTAAVAARGTGNRAPAAGTALAQDEKPRLPLQDLEQTVLKLAREWAQEALAKALAEQKKAHSSEVDLLERRIGKLSRALEEAQSELEHSQAGREIDPGVASAYRAVQGLRSERDLERKLEMLTKLVEMNLELRSQFARGG
jgi:GGDEF domain-containing protein